MVQLGLRSLCNLDHRGATGAEANVGDGAGILIQVPDAFFRAVVDFELPAAGAYAVGTAFLPKEETQGAVDKFEKLVADEGLKLLGWRDVPVDNSMIGIFASEVEPIFRQVFIGGAEG